MIELDVSQRMFGEPDALQETTPAFQLENVSFRYGATVDALCSVSVQIMPGESVAIVGANGSGKSTLLKILGGLAFPTSGRFKAFGSEIDSSSFHQPEFAHQYRRRLGVVFQNSDSQLFCPTVRDELAFGPLHMDLPVGQVERRIADVAALMELEHLLDRPPYHLSGGEKKKVAIASVLTVGPDAILLDEPTNGLDPRTQQWLTEFLRRLNHAGKTIVVATHDLDLVSHISSKAVVLNEAHSVERIGPASEILQDSGLLVRVNLIHEHVHWHGNLCHIHPHFHGHSHEHEHEHEG